MEYASIIWNNCNETDSDRLEAIQRRAACIITGGIVRTSSNLLYVESALELLSNRRERIILLFMHKIMYGNCPDYLKLLKPETNINRHNRNLRSAFQLDPPKFRLNKYGDSLLPKAISLWNKLETSIRNTANFALFKTLLEKNIPKSNPLFDLGKRKTNIIMARIRMNCSELKGHLFKLKITNNPACQCGYFFEDAVHYFFVCPLYAQQRLILQYYVSRIASFDLYTLLNGSRKLDCSKNKELYLQILKYVEDTARFQ